MKLLILDADGVLWAGVAGQRIQPYYNVQRVYRDMCAASGIRLALLTRNTIAHIRSAFDDPRMVLTFEDFDALQFECEDKAAGIALIVGSWGFDPADVTYVDDELEQCELVMDALPMVNVVHAPRKHALDVARAVAESI